MNRPKIFLGTMDAEDVYDIEKYMDYQQSKLEEQEKAIAALARQILTMQMNATDNYAASDKRIVELEAALGELVDGIEDAGGHDENGDVFDIRRACELLAEKRGGE